MLLGNLVNMLIVLPCKNLRMRTPCCAVTNHGVEELEARQFKQSRKFFALPEAVKREIMMDENLRCYSV